MTITLFCPRCGGVEVPRHEVQLELWRQGRPNTYGFDCPSCRDHVTKPAGASILRALEETAGATDSGESAPIPEVPPFTYDDLLDFHFELESEEAIAAFFDLNAAAYGLRT